MLRREPQAAVIAAESDERLLMAAAQGDRDALGALYDRFASSMVAVGQRILGSQREAEDVVQDVFLEAWHRARYYDKSRGSVRTWLMLRLRSRALDRLRAHKRGAAVSLEATATWQPEVDAGFGHDGPALQRALAELPEEQRAALELSYFAGLSYPEVADRLAVPVGTIKSRISRAIAALRARLESDKRGSS